MQRKLKCPNEHWQVLTVFHSKLRFEDDEASKSMPGRPYPNHPWALQLHGDILMLKVLDDGLELTQAVGFRTDKLMYNEKS